MYVCVIGTCLDDVSLRAIKRKAMLRIFVDRFEIHSVFQGMDECCPCNHSQTNGYTTDMAGAGCAWCKWAIGEIVYSSDAADMSSYIGLIYNWGE